MIWVQLAANLQATQDCPVSFSAPARYAGNDAQVFVACTDIANWSMASAGIVAYISAGDNETVLKQLVTQACLKHSALFPVLPLEHDGVSYCLRANAAQGDLFSIVLSLCISSLQALSTFNNVECRGFA